VLRRSSVIGRLRWPSRCHWVRRAREPSLLAIRRLNSRMGGLEAAKRLRSLAKGAPMLLVALTGWGQEQDQQRTREAGFDLHLLKPINRAELDKVLAASSSSVMVM
jgi:CheY-like chemotaxis protein